MQQDYKPIDDFLRGKVDEAKFAFKEEYWTQMASILDEKEKKRKSPWFWRGLSVFVISLAITSGAYLYKNYSTHQPLKNNVISETDVNIASNTTLPSSSTPIQNEKTKTKNTLEKIENKSAENKIKPLDNSLFRREEADQKNGKHVNQTKTRIINNSPQNMDNPTIEAIAKSESKKNIPNSLSSQQKRANYNLVVLSTNTKQAIKEKTSKNKNSLNRKNLLQENLGSTSKNATTSKDLFNSLAKNKSIRKASQKMEEPMLAMSSIKEEKDQVSTMQVLGKTMQAKDTTTYYTASKRDDSKYNPRYISSLVNYIPERLDHITEITLQPAEPKPGSTISNEKNSIQEINKENYKMALCLFTGMNINKGFNTGLTLKTAWAISPSIGIGIEKQISNKITMASHIGFTYLNGLNSSLQITQYSYGFGIDSSLLTISHKQLLQFYLPFSLYYTITGNHSLFGSVGASYSTDVYSKVEETSMTINSGFSNVSAKKPSVSTKNEFGYRTGFNPLDIFVQVGYGYSILPNLMLQASVQKGFLDVTKNQYFKNTISNTQTRFSIGFKYSFQRK